MVKLVERLMFHLYFKFVLDQFFLVISDRPGCLREVVEEQPELSSASPLLAPLGLS